MAKAAQWENFRALLGLASLTPMLRVTGASLCGSVVAFYLGICIFYAYGPPLSIVRAFRGICACVILVFATKGDVLFQASASCVPERERGSGSSRYGLLPFYISAPFTESEVIL